MSQVRVTQYSSVEAGTSEDDILEVNQPQVGTLNVGPAKVGVLPFFSLWFHLFAKFLQD